MQRLDVASCPLNLTQNDGTLLDALSAVCVPIRTFLSGATSSSLELQRHAACNGI
ncbi:hypothetical protein BDV12DRAFT_170356 [Aspergillus spectabilis]